MQRQTKRIHIEPTGPWRRPVATALVVAFLTVGSLAIPPDASAAYLWSEGGTKRFGGTADSDLVKIKTSTQYKIQLDRTVVAKFGEGAAFNPQTAQRLSNGNTLVADPTAGVVIEYNAAGKEVWKHSTGADGGAMSPYAAQRIGKEDTLIVDRAGKTVFVWDKDKEEVEWRYPGGSGTLTDPVYAVRLSDGTTLICDAEGSHVYKISSKGDIKWKLGDGTAGHDLWQVGSPQTAQSLSNGNVLIADKTGHRVIEMSPATGEIKWRWGQAGTSGSGLNRLKSPTAATRLSDGSTMIVDSGNKRLLRVSKSNVAEEIDASTLSLSGMNPVAATVTPSGTTLVVDQSNHRLIEYGYAKNGSYTSDKLGFGSAAKKRITRIEAYSTRPTDTAVKIQYSVNGRSWKSASGPSVTFATGLTATYLRVRVNLSTSDRGVTPTLDSLTVTYDALATAGTAGSSNWSQFYGQSFAPYNPNSAAAGVAAGAKAAGAAGALPQGTAVPGVASTTLYSGFLMQRVANGAQMTKDSKGLPGLPIDPAGTTAALLFITAVYSVGLASTTLSQVGHTALQSLKSVLLRSTNG